MKKMIVIIACALIAGVALQSYMQAESIKQKAQKKYQQVKKWAGEHKAEIAAGVAVAGTLAAGAAAAKYQADKEQQERAEQMRINEERLRESGEALQKYQESLAQETKKSGLGSSMADIQAGIQRSQEDIEILKAENEARRLENEKRKEELARLKAGRGQR